MQGVSLGNGQLCIAYTIYGWTGGHESKRQAARTDDLICIVAKEHNNHPECMLLLQGDLNADCSDLPHLTTLLKTKQLIDVGACASHWGGIDNDFTCLTANSSSPTRRDYMFTCQSLYDNISSLCMASISPHMRY